MTGVDNPVWRDASDFYERDDRRNHSVERELPGMWYMEGWDHHYRLYWLEQTGEIVAIASQAVEQTSAVTVGSVVGQRVELIAWADSFSHAEAMLKGWSSHSAQLKSYYWLRRRAGLVETPVVPGREVTDDHRRRAQENAGSLF